MLASPIIFLPIYSSCFTRQTVAGVIILFWNVDIEIKGDLVS